MNGSLEPIDSRSGRSSKQHLRNMSVISTNGIYYDIKLFSQKVLPPHKHTATDITFVPSIWS